MNLYNNSITHRWNKWFRNIFLLPKMRKNLINKNITILCNNCNGGIVSHDLGLRFNSPTVNLYFKEDGFYSFCENLDYYLAQDLFFKGMNIDGGVKYPVFTLGAGNQEIELHFLHYHTENEARTLWNRRKSRIDKSNLFVIMSFFEKSDESHIKRFELLPQTNRVIFTEIEYPQYPHTFCIKGFPKGLNVLSLFHGLLGHRRLDQFDFVHWFNSGNYRRVY